MSEELKRLQEALYLTHKYYGHNLDPETLSLMISDLEDVSPDVVIAALKKYRLDSKNKFAPTPAQLLDIISPQKTLTDRDEGSIVASEIERAIRTCGYTNPTGAKTSMSQLAWEVVERTGGWVYMCQNVEEDSLPTLKAQWRDLAMGLKKMTGKTAIQKTEVIDNPIFEFKKLSSI